jgi:hypothetical protein
MADGFLGLTTAGSLPNRKAAFLEGLRDLSYPSVGVQVTLTLLPGVVGSMLDPPIGLGGPISRRLEV